MIGDKPDIKPIHRKLAAGILSFIIEPVQQSGSCYAVSIAGESGSGKSSIAEALKAELSKSGIDSLILQQDDYFVLPPITNDRTRRKDINWVGLQEVRLDLLDEHLHQSRSGKDLLTKPLVLYAEDRIITEKISLQNIKVVIAEGTYTTNLKNIDCRVFIDLDYRQTKQFRDDRARDKQDEFIEQVLEIEHRIIVRHKQHADLIITPEFSLRKNLIMKKG
ncbi:hypothetical protein GF337_10900 [candidate division KSB1 bacterium]|nr:hypothetical protein [candidate division KSB1 bacterium]